MAAKPQSPVGKDRQPHSTQQQHHTWPCSIPSGPGLVLWCLASMQTFSSRSLAGITTEAANSTSSTCPARISMASPMGSGMSQSSSSQHTAQAPGNNRQVASNAHQQGHSSSSPRQGSKVSHVLSSEQLHLGGTTFSLYSGCLTEVSYEAP